MWRAASPRRARCCWCWRWRRARGSRSRRSRVWQASRRSLRRNAAAAQPAAAPRMPDAALPSQTAIEAIGASHQGVFELDFADEAVVLSGEAAALVGLGAGRMAHGLWMARIHPDDRDDLRTGDGRFRRPVRARLPHRIPRALGERQLSLARTARDDEGPGGRPAERCVGLLADITVRKESEAAMMDRTLRDPLTGLGNRVALMEELEALGARLHDAIVRLARHRPLQGHPCQPRRRRRRRVLTSLAQRLVQQFLDVAQIFRVGGDAFAVLFTRRRKARPRTRRRVGGGLRRGVPAWRAQRLRAGQRRRHRGPRGPRSASICLKNAELALLQAKRQGGDCARVYTPRAGGAGARRRGGARSRASPRHRRRRDRGLLSAHRPADGSFGGGLRGAAALAPSDQGAGGAGRLHRPFRGDRADRRARAVGAQARRQGPGAMAALLPAARAAVRQRQSLAPPVVRSRVWRNSSPSFCPAPRSSGAR